MILVWTSKLVGQKGCSVRLDVVFGRITLVSHHLGLLLGVIKLTILCAFVCKVGYFDAQIRETLLYK